MTDLLELAERCEKATGPDRELDKHLAHQAGWSHFFVQKDMWWKSPEGWSRSDPPRYTASLDAAMTLASEIRHIEWCEGFVEAVVWREPDHCYFHTAKAATPALALCAAALRARASGEQTKL